MKLSKLTNVRIPAAITGLFLLASTIVAPASTIASVSSAPLTDADSTNSDSVQGMPEWIVQAMPYVHVSNYIATIDPEISTNMTADDVEKVKQSVEQYNNLPLDMKKGFISRSISVPHTTKSPGCGNSYVHQTSYWWGSEVYFNHCAAQDAQNAAQLANLIPILGVYVNLEASALSQADSNCSNQGAYLDVSAIVAGLAWVRSIC